MRVSFIGWHFHIRVPGQGNHDSEVTFCKDCLVNSVLSQTDSTSSNTGQNQPQNHFQNHLTSFNRVQKRIQRAEFNNIERC